MTERLPEACRKPITDLASAISWIEALCAADLGFHFEDDPEDILSGPDSEPTFSEKDLPLIRECVELLYEQEWGVWNCPIGYMLAYEAFAGSFDIWAKNDLVDLPDGGSASVAFVGRGEDRKRAILKLSAGGFIVAYRTMEQYADGSFSNDFSERDPFSSAEDASAKAGGLWA